jgi:hypothetical protein
LVEWMAGETEVLGENLSQCHFVHHKPHMCVRMRSRHAAVGSQRLTVWAMARPKGEVRGGREMFVLNLQTELNWGVV